jgi:hypothetical protein
MWQRAFILGFPLLVILFNVHAPLSAEEASEKPQGAAKVLPLRHAIARGIQQNFGVLAEELNVPARKQDVTVNEAVFDPLLMVPVIYSYLDQLVQWQPWTRVKKKIMAHEDRVASGGSASQGPLLGSEMQRR